VDTFYFKLNIYSHPLGQRTTPSTVAFTDDGQRLVGIPAKRQVSSHSLCMSDPLLMPSTTLFLILFLFININRLSQIQNIQFSQVRDSLVEDSMMSQLKKI
jgi:hypothetical protein